MEVSRLVHQIAEDVYYVEQDRFIFEDPSLSGFNAPVASPISGSEISLGSPKASNDKDIPTNFALKSDDEEIEIKVDHSVNVEGLQVSISPQKQEIVTTLTTPIFEFEFPEVIGRYQVLEKIGEGTFSSVYKAISYSNGQVVAIKRINPTCSPDRILNEMKHLHLLGGKGHVAPLLGALRSGDQVSLVLPYVEHEKFKDYLPHMNLHQIKGYMRSLFQALEHLHAHKIIHRDLKPGNFLYNPKTETYVLVDFGLAQNQIDVSPEPILINEKSTGSPLKRRRNDGTYEQQSLQAMNKRIKCPTISSRVNSPVTVHRIRNISQKSLRAPRGGTRGFRAPEVLMKCLNQTVAIDVWSAGVILLCVLSTRYPFFNAPDDLVSLAELSSLFGTREVRDVAILLNRRVHFPVEITKPSLKQVCNALTCRKEVMPDSAFHLLARCLDINPNTRITASEALRHPFLNEA